MLDKNDIRVLQGMFEAFEVKINTRFDAQDRKFDQKLDDLKVDLRDEMHSSISASEHRLMAKMDALEVRVVSNVCDFLDQAIIPQIKDLQTDVVVIKQHLKLA